MKKNNTLIDHEHHHHSNRFLNNPSFSSTLLDQIYRSIDQPENHNYTNTPNNMKSFFAHTSSKTENNKKQSSKDNNSNVSSVVGAETEQQFDTTTTRRRTTSRDYDNDVTCFSSTSLSSDSGSSSSSSSGGFSSSDTESLYGARSRTRSSSSCFLPLRPVRTSASASSSLRDEEKGDDHHRKFHSFRHDFKTELGALIGSDDHGEDDYEALSMKSKSRALKIYNNLKKVKQPISPGAKITSFLNSIFASSKKSKCTNHDIKIPSEKDRLHGSDNSIREKKPKTIQTSLPPSSCSFSRSCLSKNLSSEREKLCNDIDNLKRIGLGSGSSKNLENDARKAKLFQTSTHPTSSLSISTSTSTSFSKSCLSKTLTTSEKEKLRNETKRKVRFYPVSVVVGEEGTNNNNKITATWKNGINMEKSKVVKEAAREFLEEYHKNKNNLVLEGLMDIHKNKMNNANEDDDNDDVASCASSDLFELDHLAELPVYETTHVGTIRAIANGLVV